MHSINFIGAMRNERSAFVRTTLRASERAERRTLCAPPNAVTSQGIPRPKMATKIPTRKLLSPLLPSKLIRCVNCAESARNLLSALKTQEFAH